jgi:hypothetical protein
MHDHRPTVLSWSRAGELDDDDLAAHLVDTHGASGSELLASRGDLIERHINLHFPEVTTVPRRPKILVDFDGPLHRYSKGWQDGTVYDDMTPGADLAIGRMLSGGYEVVIFSTRDAVQIQEAMARWGMPPLRVTNVKEPAVAQIDDRAIWWRDWDSAWTELVARYPVDRSAASEPAAPQYELRDVGFLADGEIAMEKLHEWRIALSTAAAAPVMPGQHITEVCAGEVLSYGKRRPGWTSLVAAPNGLPLFVRHAGEDPCGCPSR